MGRFASKNQVWQVIEPLIAHYWASPGKSRYVGFADANYYLPSRTEIDALVNKIPLEQVKFFGEVFDCDDYAFLMKGLSSKYARDVLKIHDGLCLGIAWGRFSWQADPEHACNWILDESQELLWLEPQDRKVFSLDQCQGELVLFLV